MVGGGLGGPKWIHKTLVSQELNVGDKNHSKRILSIVL